MSHTATRWQSAKIRIGALSGGTYPAGLPGLAFQLSHLAAGPHEPTPIGVFRAVERPTYETLMQDQLIAAQEQQGPGDLGAAQLHRRLGN